MFNQTNKPDSFEELRERAKELLGYRPKDSGEYSSDIMNLIEELKIHQTELEIQNEELKRLQWKLSELHKKYLDLYDFAPCGYVILSSRGLISEINLTGARLLGADRNKLYLFGLGSYVAREHQGVYFKALRQTGQSDQTKVLEFKLNRANLPDLWVRAEIMADLSESGEVQQWRLAFMDITERIHFKNALKSKVQELNQTNELIEIILESTPYMLAYMDRDFNFIRVNRAYAEAGKRDPDDFIGKNHFNLYPDEKNERIFKEVVDTAQAYSMEKMPFNHPDQPERGTTYWDWNLIPIKDEDGAVSYLMLSIYDVTNYKKEEEARKKNQEFWEKIIRSQITGLYIYNFELEQNDFINQQYTRYSGWSIEDIQKLSSHKFAELFHPDDRGLVQEHMRAIKYARDEDILDIEYRFRTKDGQWIWCWSRDTVFERNEEGIVKRYLGTFLDITDRKMYEEQIEKLSLYDSLTGLYNRNFFDLEMERLSDNRYMPVGLVVCDLDCLKFVNDTLGHSSGDEMLSNVANILKRSIRSSEIVARIGGDEFAILLPEIDEKIMHGLVQRLRREIEHFNARNSGLPVSLSIGYAVGSTEDTDMEALFHEADTWMYNDKVQKEHSSRNAIVQGLIKTAEARDFITENQGNRLQELVVSFARTINLPEDRISYLRLFARFHDLGKVGVHDQILFKPASLTESEFQEMRKHSEVGHRIAQSIEDMAPIADWILKHHERWDGLGYPFGLQGRDIPLECRILAIADAFNVMTSDRPYQNAMTPYEAVRELRRCAGTQFDPDLVDKFIQIQNINDIK